MKARRAINRKKYLAIYCEYRYIESDINHRSSVMTRSRTITAPFLQSRNGRPWPLPRHSGEAREALGSESEKSNGHKDSMPLAEFPERVATLANRSERIAQVLVPPVSSAAFGSDSRGEKFFP